MGSTRWNELRRVLRLPSQKRHWLRQLAKQLSLCEEVGELHA